MKQALDWSCLTNSSKKHVLIPKQRVGACLSAWPKISSIENAVLDLGTLIKVCLSEKVEKISKFKLLYNIQISLKFSGH